MKKDRPLHPKKEFENIRGMVEEIGSLYEGKVACRYRKNPHDKEAVKVYYEEFRDHIRAIASEYIARGYNGKRIVCLGKHTYSWIQCYYATLATASVLIPLDRDWAKEDLLETVRTGEGEIIFCDKDVLDKGEFIASELGLPAPIVLDGEGENSLSGMLSAGAEKFAADKTPYYSVEIDVDALAMLVFTSGTTGKGKGVMLSQRNFMSDLAEVIPFIDFSTRCINVLPPHHTYGSSVSIYGQMSIGCDIYISSGVKYILKELQEHKPGHLVAVPLYVETFYRRIIKGIKDSGKEKLVYTLIKISNALRKIGIDLRSLFFKKSILKSFGGELNMIISGGAPLNQEMADLFDSIGITVLNGYGITECAPIIAVNHNKYIVPKSVGPVLPIDEVVIDEPNEDGEGEILVRGSNVMLGYYKNEEANREAIDENGFFHTGDYGKLVTMKDGARVIYITGRKKNLIILSNGKNVYPEEIEDALAATPGVLEIVVYEGKSKRGDAYNAIVAEIFCDKDYMAQNGITDVESYLRGYVNEYNRTAVPYKKIAVLKVREEEFPKNTLRKILRRMIDMTID
ncbi:MAG: AMP-binding protein [Clostridia bacterium]|nr:AMP-binding protein [Clostridia bacterium]